ncbi:luciferase family protein [Niallia circulans]|uniref:LLM class flavin-dependent oxidoreductase n=1 Tax=Niallia circulans TaxID=1397 RepID=UPI00077C189E|nr:LLM class flavin-dependent oxidoreductase [Niallia circulans]MDR4316705.1 LLM class flavin-dependent oxidoreductase [Niallia circulans]MED3840303.1 LLM class flavin-dependent oxidoreductase [Niallia circulans]MED4241991.1 LLM class flavin-dependent oxidoreductase [Niallia circulans]MED4249576.1 LLM class flavin-dependent oxidoreductase [Niallia circulans]QKH59213.1 LLM class flavin-dependent oxidoreductase [Niallia circulans]
MKLSILDQAPVLSGKSAQEALKESMKLAQSGEKLGYTRYWIAEHHDFPGLASSAPEVMLGYIGANTEKIRIGAGAILLPHYKPYKVAETFNMLATLFPNRIDLGIGRAPGGSAEASIALSGNFLENVRNMPNSIKDLLHFLYNNYPTDQMFSKITAHPLPDIPPVPWILGTSEKSAIQAASYGTAYAFGHFMSDKDGIKIVNTYRNAFRQSSGLQKPQAIITVSVICAETSELAEELALSWFLSKIQTDKGEKNNRIPTMEEARNYSFTSDEKERIQEMRKKMMIGNPKEVKQQLAELQAVYSADEIMIVTITNSYESRRKSYELIAKEVW